MTGMHPVSQAGRKERNQVNAGRQAAPGAGVCLPLAAAQASAGGTAWGPHL